MRERNGWSCLSTADLAALRRVVLDGQQPCNRRNSQPVAAVAAIRSFSGLGKRRGGEKTRWRNRLCAQKTLDRYFGSRPLASRRPSTSRTLVISVL